MRRAVRDGESGQTDWGRINCVEQADLTPHDNWQVYFTSLTGADLDAEWLTELSTIGEIHRGIQTGRNDVFCLTDGDVSEWDIDHQYLSRLVPSPRNIQGYDFRPDDWERLRAAGEDIWLLYHYEDIEGVPEDLSNSDRDSHTSSAWESDKTGPTEEPGSGAAAYLRAALKDNNGFRDNRTLSDRACWYRVDRREPAPILVPYMGRDDLQVVLNKTNARHLNNLHGIYPDSSLDDAEVKALLAYLNSEIAQRSLREQLRIYSDGLTKWEPADLAAVQVIDPRALPHEIVADLADAFDALCDAAGDDDRLEEIQTRIETTLQQVGAYEQ